MLLDFLPLLHGVFLFLHSRSLTLYFVSSVGNLENAKIKKRHEVVARNLRASSDNVFIRFQFFSIFYQKQTPSCLNSVYKKYHILKSCKNIGSWISCHYYMIRVYNYRSPPYRSPLLFWEFSDNKICIGFSYTKYFHFKRKK